MTSAFGGQRSIQLSYGCKIATRSIAQSDADDNDLPSPFARRLSRLGTAVVAAARPVRRFAN